MSWQWYLLHNGKGYNNNEFGVQGTHECRKQSYQQIASNVISLEAITIAIFYSNISILCR